MAILTFSAADIRELVTHTKAAAQRRPSYAESLNPAFHTDGKTDDAKIPPGLWLVKDDGIYLMSNGTPYPRRSATDDRARVAYAAEANPDEMSPEAAWNAARALLGGGDFVQALPLDMFEWLLASPRVKKLKLRITEKAISLV